MALIQCPECGSTVSDKAAQCPKCGCPLTATPPEPAASEPLKVDAAPVLQKKATAKKIDKKKIILPVIFIAILASGVLGFRVYQKSNITVADLTISKWRLLESGSYSDKYEATITSSQTQPFVAVIGEYDSESNNNDLVYMENGTGNFTTYESVDDDPSLVRVPVGYLKCDTVSDRDIADIKYKVSNYSDYGGSTSCLAEITVEMKNKKTGVLLVEISNDMNKAVNDNFLICIVNGQGKASKYLNDLPEKSRGVTVTATPVAFCPAQTLQESDYTVLEPFAVEKNKTFNSYSGSESIKLGDICENGFLIYTTELTDGGNAEEVGEVNISSSVIANHLAKMSTYDYYDSDAKVITPQYTVTAVACMPFLSLDAKK